jgi:hypothetical protein
MSRSRMVNDPAARAAARAKAVPILAKFVRRLVDEYGPEHGELPLVIARRYLAGMGDDLAGRRFPELAVVLRGIVALGGDGKLRRTADEWLTAHCRGCGVEIEGKQTACPSCRAAWKELDPGESKADADDSADRAA